MHPNNSLSYQDSSKLKHQLDQFMPSMPKNTEGPSFQNFMQACFSNPSFFESMRNFYVTQNQKSTGQSLSTPYQGLNIQPYQQSQPNLSNKSRYEVNYQSDTRSEQFQREIEVPKTNQMKKKHANPPNKYFPPQSASNERANEPLSKPTIPPPNPSFQERPIKSNYTIALNINSQAFDLNTIKENQSINIENPKKKVKNFEQEPIKGMKQYQMESYYKQPGEKNKSSIASYQDERPIKGLSKDFKEAIRQQFPNPMDREQNHHKQDESENMKPEPRAFLKRGSRQHLSSAMNKSKQPKNNLDKSLNKSQIEDQPERSITPKRTQPEIRTLSQNKVLSKKNNYQQDKSTSKLPTKKNDFSDDQFNNQKAKPYLNKQKPPKPQQKSSKSFQKSQVPMKNIKKKNVFNDDSQSSSSSEEEVSPTFKTKNIIKKDSYKNVEMEEYDKKIEVIQGVYLSQQQLDQIISLYSKPKEVPKESQSEKVAALRRKYNEMIALKDQQMEKYKQQLEKEREQFQKYKVDQLNKLKSERKIMERQVKGGLSSQNLQKEKEELQSLKQELEKQKEDFKRKDKNNKIIIEKYKRQIEELKSKIDKLENEITSNRRQNTLTNRVEENYTQQKPAKSLNGSVKSKKVEEQQKSQEISYKDLKKTNKFSAQEIKETKTKYEYVEEETFSKNKSFSTKQEKKQTKPQNKWASHKFTNSDESASVSGDQQQAKIVQTSKTNEWSPAMKLSDLTKINLSIKMVNQQMIDSLFRYQKNVEYLRYLQSTKLPTRTVVNSTRNNANNYTTKIYSDRTKQLVYDNGTRKVSCQNGYSIVYFKNGDIKQTLPDKTVLYYFNEKEVDQITLSNGVNIYRFENDQVEIHFANGSIEIRHPDGTIKVLGDQIRR